MNKLTKGKKWTYIPLDHLVLPGNTPHWAVAVVRDVGPHVHGICTTRPPQCALQPGEGPLLSPDTWGDLVGFWILNNCFFNVSNGAAVTYDVMEAAESHNHRLDVDGADAHGRQEAPKSVDKWDMTNMKRRQNYR